MHFSSLLTRPADYRFAYVLAFLLPIGLIVSRALAETSCVAIGLLFLWNSHRTRQWSWFSDPIILIGVAAVCWYCAVVSPFALSPFESFTTSISWVRFIILYAAFRYWLFKSIDDISLVMHGLLVVLTLVMLDTFFQYLTGTSVSGNPIVNDRLSGPFDNVKVGIFLAKLFIPVAAYYLYIGSIKHHSGQKIAGVFLAIGAVVIILLSGERTAFASTLLGLIITLSLIIFYSRDRLKILLCILFAVAGLLVVFISQEPVQNRIAQFVEVIRTLSSNNYGALFKAGITLGSEHWLTGIGLKGFAIVCPDVINPAYFYECTSHPHNPYIEWFAAGGVPALCLLVAMVAAMVMTSATAVQKTERHQIILPTFVLGLLVVNFFPFMSTQSMFSNWPALLMWYGLALGMSLLPPVSGKAFRFSDHK